MLCRRLCFVATLGISMEIELEMKFQLESVKDGFVVVVDATLDGNGLKAEDYSVRLLF